MLPANGLIPFRRNRARASTKRTRTTPEIHQRSYDEELNEEYKRQSRPIQNVTLPSLDKPSAPSHQNLDELSKPELIKIILSAERSDRNHAQVAKKDKRDEFDSDDDQDEICYSDLFDEVESLKQQVKLLKQKVSDSEACCIHQNEVIRLITRDDINDDTTIHKRQLTRYYNSITQAVKTKINDEDKQKIWLILFDVDAEQEVSSDTKAILNNI